MGTFNQTRAQALLDQRKAAKQELKPFFDFQCGRDNSELELSKIDRYITLLSPGSFPIAVVADLLEGYSLEEIADIMISTIALAKGARER